MESPAVPNCYFLLELLLSSLIITASKCLKAMAGTYGQTMVPLDSQSQQSGVIKSQVSQSLADSAATLEVSILKQSQPDSNAHGSMACTHKDRWYPSEVLKGTVTIYSKACLVFEKVTVVFEGSTLNTKTSIDYLPIITSGISRVYMRTPHPFEIQTTIVTSVSHTVSKWYHRSRRLLTVHQIVFITIL